MGFQPFPLIIGSSQTIYIQHNNKNLHRFASTKKDHTLINMNDNINTDIIIAGSMIAPTKMTAS